MHTSLLELNRVLTAVIEDKRIKSLVKVLKADYKIFEKLREILENRDKKPREVVEGRMRRFLRYMEKKAAKEKKYASLVLQIKKFWNGLFHTYDHESEDEQRHGAVHRALQEEMEEDYRLLANERVDHPSCSHGYLHVQHYWERFTAE